VVGKVGLIVIASASGKVTGSTVRVISKVENETHV
jgi:hypothetical protein